MTVVNPKSISGINSITTGSGSDNLLTIHTSDANNTERVRVNSSGDVIVGSGVTLSPDGDIFATGVCTATSFVGSGANLTGVASTENIRTNTNATFLQNINVSGTTTAAGNINVSGANITLQDSGGSSDDRLVFGAGSDLSIYHDGNNSVIEDSGTGNLIAKASTFHVKSTGGEDILKGITDGAVELYHNNNKQCETSANGLAFPAGKGIDFSAQTATSVSGASATAEVLDHYEEGTWTAFFKNVSAPTYEAQGGRYTRIGRMVFCDCTIGVASGLDTSDGSAVQIAGLPFTGSAGGGDTCLLTIGRYSNVLGGKQNSVHNVRFTGSGVILQEGNDLQIAYNEINSSGYLQMSFAFMIA